MIQLDETTRELAIKEWRKLSQRKRDLAIEDLEYRNARMACCEPYDCMCHETCGEEYGGYCGYCKHGAELRKATKGIPAIVWSLVREIVEEDRMAILKHELQTIRDLEAVGDYAAAERILEGAC